jgi:exonuclease SbcD
MIKLLHFADAHIDIAAHGRHDAESGLPVRVLDFLKALDTIIDTAIKEKVDLVIFAGDAYKDRSPAPTFQREWGRRIMRLSNAAIPTLLLVGNHDVSPANGRATTLQEFDTLEVPHVHVIYKPELLKPKDLEGLPLQVLGLPWVYRSGLMASLGLSGTDLSAVNEQLETRLSEILNTWMEQLDPNLPTLLTAHGSVQGALYGNERTVMLGKDLVLPGGLVKDPRLDYVALGHIHKAQDVNEGSQPPVIYPGSIERVDFGEVGDDKYFVIANIEKGKTTYKFHKLHGRRFFDRSIKIKDQDGLMQKVLAALPSETEMKDAIGRLTIEYPRELDVFIDEPEIRKQCEGALEFHLIRKPQEEARLRLPADQTLASLTSMQMLDLYWTSIKSQPTENDKLKSLAESIIDSINNGSLSGEG